MSVQYNTYVVWGAKFPWLDNGDELDPYYDSAYEGIHHHNGVCVLSDGYDGKYTVIGRVLAKTDENGLFDCPPIDLTQMIFDAKNDIGLSEEIEKIAGTDELELGLWVFTHYR